MLLERREGAQADYRCLAAAGPLEAPAPVVAVDGAHLRANEISAPLSDEMKDWIRDAEQSDDLTFIVMKVR